MKDFAEFRDKKIFYQVTGKGPDIVLLHGFLESSGLWKNFARKLSATFRVVKVDLPGHGLSEAPGSHTTIDLMAEAVHQVIKAMGINHCLMVGHSMGGYVALAYAEKHPKILKGLVLFHSHAGADSPEVQANRERTIAVIKKDRRGFIKHYIPDLFDAVNVKKFPHEIAILEAMADETPKEGIISALQAMKNRPDRQHVLTQLKAPVLFIIGKNDSRVPLQLIIPQTFLPEHSEVLMLDHVGHMGFIESSGKTFAVLKGFAERLG